MQVAESMAEDSRYLPQALAKTHSRQTLPKVQDIVSGQVKIEASEVRWLAPGTTLAEMHDLAQTFLPESQVSYSLFVSVYHCHWERKLKIRPDGMHAKCSTCERFKQYRRQCTSETDSKRVRQEHAMHHEAVMLDRHVDSVLCMNSRMSCGILPGNPDVQLLSMCIDAMDAAKFRIPRNISASKEFERLWRPQLHMIGCITPLTEFYFLTDLDVCKDSNLQATVVATALEQTYKQLQAGGRSMPTELRVHTDNATAEGKNQTMMYLASWLVHKKLFKRVTLSQFRVGHSHGLNDQRFSECRRCLNESCVLEDPDAFQEALKTRVTPKQDRTLEVQRIHAAADFKSFFERLDLQMSGHTQTKGKTDAGAEAVHVFSFTLRENLSEELHSSVKEFPGYHPDSQDVILTCQLYLGSDELSQKPCVLATPQHFQKLGDTQPRSLAPRVEFSEKQRAEFQKTAEKISAPPWNMDRGCSYLLKLLQDNADNQSGDWQPPPMAWSFLPHRPAEDSAGLPATPRFTDETFQWAHTVPAPVAVKSQAKKSHGPSKLLCRVPPAPGNPAASAGSQQLRDGALLPDADAAEPELPSPPSEIGEGGEWSVQDQRDPVATAQQGAPEACFGTQGAPAGVIAAAPKPKAKAKSEAKGKAKAKAKGKAKAKAKSLATAKAKAKAAPKPKAQAGKRPLPQPEDAVVGCSKCRPHMRGCTRCRTKAGLILNEAGTAWVWP